MSNIHSVSMKWIEDLDSNEKKTENLVSNYETTDYLHYTLPILGEKVIIHDLIFKGKYISGIELTIGGQVVSNDFKCSQDGEKQEWHLYNPKFLAPFAHKHHELSLEVRFTQPSSITIDRIVSFPTDDVIKQLTSESFHTLTSCNKSTYILRYASGMVGKLCVA